MGEGINEACFPHLISKEMKIRLVTAVRTKPLYKSTIPSKITIQSYRLEITPLYVSTVGAVLLYVSYHVGLWFMS